jgi:hypothetical protein
VDAAIAAACFDIDSNQWYISKHDVYGAKFKKAWAEVTGVEEATDDEPDDAEHVWDILTDEEETVEYEVVIRDSDNPPSDDIGIAEDVEEPGEENNSSEVEDEVEVLTSAEEPEWSTHSEESD